MSEDEKLVRLDLSHLKELKDGWYDENSKSITDAAIKTAEYIQVVPMFSGGVQIELHAGGMDVEIVVEPDGRIFDICASRTRDKKE